LEPITSFKGEYAFLSNFYACPLTIDGMSYPTAEHAFQAAKTHDRAVKQAIADKDSPTKAKHAGGKRRGSLITGALFRSDWEAVKLSVMKDILRLKFSDPQLRQALLATRDAPLVEGNSWNDTFWGVCRGRGQNHLGRLLQEVRTEIRTSGSASPTCN
jgi:ribA/ribD-fused uncharacterized protein